MNSLDIRRAIIIYANSIGRPHYEPIVIRELTQAFINGTDHPLKSVIRPLVWLGD